MNNGSPRLVHFHQIPTAGPIWVFLGSEVTIGSQLTLFLNQHDILNVSVERAGKLVSFYWMGAMIGRFVGSGIDQLGDKLGPIVWQMMPTKQRMRCRRQWPSRCRPGGATAYQPIRPAVSR